MTESMMAPTRLAAAVVLVLGAGSAALAQTYTHYECEGGSSFEVVAFPDNRTAYVQIDGKSLQLPKRFSLTGQRFSRNGITFTRKSGGAATIHRAGRTSQCRAR